MLPITMGSLIRLGERQTRHTTTLCSSSVQKKKSNNAGSVRSPAFLSPTPLRNMTVLSWSGGQRSDLSTKKKTGRDGTSANVFMPLRRVAFEHLSLDVRLKINFLCLWRKNLFVSLFPLKERKEERADEGRG